MAQTSDTSESRWEALWRRAHELRRELAFRNPLANTGPLVFAKQVPSCFSHQLTQYYGMCARPGGGIFVLDAPGRSMHTTQLADLPTGSYQHPEVSWDGRHILFAYCEAPTAPANRTVHQERNYHIYEVAVGRLRTAATDGRSLRRFLASLFARWQTPVPLHATGRFSSLRRRTVSGLHAGHRRGRRIQPATDLLS